jgi:hypothetical protein
MRRRVSSPDGTPARSRLPVPAAEQGKSRNLVRSDDALDVQSAAQNSQSGTGERGPEASRSSESVLGPRDFPEWVPKSVREAAIMLSADYDFDPTWTAGPVFAVQNGRNAEG